MMKLRIFGFLIVSIFFLVTGTTAQIALTEKYKSTYLYKLNNGDSVVYYQCRYVQVKDSNTDSVKKSTRTDKFVILKTDSGYTLRHYESMLMVYPNRKFSGLKSKERPYWNFEYKTKKYLNNKEMEFMAAMQLKGRETTEYDFAITKRTTNQIIIRYKRQFDQLLMEDKWVLTDLIKRKKV